LAKDAYERVLKENPSHAKVLQQLGWLYHHNPSFGNQDTAISYLMRSIDSDPSDGQTWYPHSQKNKEKNKIIPHAQYTTLIHNSLKRCMYLLGRCYMAQQKFRKAYDAYQQAVYRDGRNPTFWCSIGVLYYQVFQIH
jgi:glucose repression mediator protein